MTKISITEQNKNKKLTEVCGECKKDVFNFVKCENCGMVLCNECQISEGDKVYCSSCWRDRK